ncbi:MAG: biosynthetic-type acetolactate synthase large subunit [Rhodothermia bacterium]|nr:MAG: biosynthetic-type acetolactate synthase large subunit [Rhodothermia bacterium]
MNTATAVLDQPTSSAEAVTSSKSKVQSWTELIGTEMTGAQILLRSLDAEDVEFVFGYPGGAVIGIYDEMHKIESGFEHILVRHEQGAVHAAEGYAKATGKVGTVLVTSGPGATNCVTGIADAYMDSIPVVVFTGQVPTHLIGNDAFQECDTIGVTRSITKHNFLIRDVSEIAPTVRAAYHIASSGRPGPVVVDLPKDVLAAKATFNYPSSVSLRGYTYPTLGDPDRVQEAADMISESTQPLLYVGGGTISSGAGEKLTSLARKLNIPVTTTLHGLGSFPENDPLSVGMLGMHGTWCANLAVQNADLLIAVGARFDDRVTGKIDAWAPHARIIHIDIDPACISKNVPADCPILGDVGCVLDQLEPLVSAPDTGDWLERVKTWKAECPLEYERDGNLRPQQVIEALRDKTGGHAVMVTDVGQNQMWGAQFFSYVEPRSHITSGGLGTMGFSVPAAVGAAFGLRGTGLPIISINGDGGFLMNAQEMVVAAAHGLPIKFIVLNNNYLGMVRQWQELFHEERYSYTDLSDTNPDFVKLAEAYHCVGLQCTSPEDVESTIDKAWEITDMPVLIEFQVVQEEMVFPMVPAGAASDDMITQRFNPENCA